ncbi:MAG: hypothetical protein AABW91_02630 [Nanoarchaeota archaeon]
MPTQVYCFRAHEMIFVNRVTRDKLNCIPREYFSCSKATYEDGQVYCSFADRDGEVGKKNGSTNYTRLQALITNLTR